MKHAWLPLAGLIVGIVLVALSVAWPRLFTSRAVWTDDDAGQHAAAAADFHRQTVAGPSASGALAAARQKFDESKARLDAARNRGQTTANVLFWIGLVTALTGAFTFLAVGGQPRSE